MRQVEPMGVMASMLALMSGGPRFVPDTSVNYTPKSRTLKPNPEIQAAAIAKRERKLQRNLILAGLKAVLLMILLLPITAHAQRELTARPISPIPAIRDLFKPIPDMPIEWVRTETQDPYTHIDFTTFTLRGRYLTFPFVNDKLHYPVLVLVCGNGSLYSAVMRVHGSDPGPLKMVVATDRKNFVLTAKLYDAHRIDPAGGNDRDQSVNYTLMDISSMLKVIVGSARVDFNAVGLATRFDMPIRPVGLDSSCHIK